VQKHQDYLRKPDLESLTRPADEPRADESSVEREQRAMDVEPALEANAQLARAREPSVRALDHPTMLARALAAFDASPSDPARDPAPPEIRSASQAVVALVGMQLRGSLTRQFRQKSDGWHGIDASLEHRRIVAVGSTDQYHQRDASSVYDRVTLGAELGAGPWEWDPVSCPPGAGRCRPIATDSQPIHLTSHEGPKTRRQASQTLSSCGQQSRITT